VFGAPLARRGFQVVLQSTRGTFGSGGQFLPLTTEQDDGLATVSWLRKQPWCDGRVAMTGGSYFGHTQWAVAPYAEPPLVAVSPHVIAARSSLVFYDHGAPQLQNALNWTALIGRQEHSDLARTLTSPVLRARIRRALRRLPLQAADVAVAGAPVPFWRDFVAHAEPGDEFWSTADHDRVDLARLPPVSMVTGWWDLFVRAQLTDFAALRAAGVPARIVVGPWLHGELRELRAIVRHDVNWLTHQPRGGPAPGGKPVRVFLQQAGGRWLEFDEWPRRRSGRSCCTCSPAVGWATGRPGTGPRRAGSGTTRSTRRPRSAARCCSGRASRPTTARSRPRRTSWSSPVRRCPPNLDLVGPVAARVYVRPELEHADVFVRLCDVDPAGASRNVVDGVRRLDPRTVPAADVAVGDDRVLAVDLDLFPTAYRVRVGHRLRLQVSGGAFPRYARKLGTAEPVGTATTGRAGRVEVFHDPAHPSQLQLSVLALRRSAAGRAGSELRRPGRDFRL
jgi:putative CocE/NonD family hydrolase